MADRPKQYPKDAPMADQNFLQKLFSDQGIPDFRWIDPAEIEVAQWVRVKCQFGCDSYGRNASCPPNTPSLADCRTLFGEYRLGALFRFRQHVTDPEESLDWSRSVNRALIELESAAQQAGYPRVFMLLMERCNLCRECANTRSHCRNKRMARPTAEGLGVDVSATVTKYGYPGHSPESADRYAFLLIE